MGIKNSLLEELAEYINMENIDAARLTIQKAEKELGHNFVFLKLKALFNLQIQNYDLAIECLKSARDIDPTDSEVYYYLTCAYENKERNDVKYYDFDKKTIALCTTDKDLIQRRNLVQNLLLEDNQPLVSIYVLAYNNLETATKTCVECVLKYTENIDYELILINNGSDDGTLEYFKSVPYKKKKVIHIEKNQGSVYGYQFGLNKIAGKYVVLLPNDVWVTKNWLKNMLICLESDESIGMVVPMSDNTSNFQNPNISYDNFADMQKKAEAFNVSNPLKWQERLRLITIAALCRKECIETMGFCDYGFVHNFSDDDMSFRYRQYGYKLMVCGDVFVHHIGSIITGKETKYQNDLNNGFLDFQQKFWGVDAWGDTDSHVEDFLFRQMIEYDNIGKNDAISILGIDVKCGNLLLSFKNELRAKGYKNVVLSALSQEAKYWVDLKSICNGTVRVSHIEKFTRKLYDSRFNFIAIGKPLNNYYQIFELLDECLLMLKNSGILFFYINKNDNVNCELTESKPVDNLGKLSLNISFNKICEFLKQYSQFKYQVIILNNDCDTNQIEIILQKLNLEMYKDKILNDIKIASYFFAVRKVGDL